MAADYTIKQGDVLPVFEDTLTYSNGEAAAPETVSFVMRSLISPMPLTLTGTASIVSGAKVAFAPTAADTVAPGNYMATWLARIAGKQMSFPTTGYLWVQVEENLQSTTAAQLIGLPEVKDYCNIQANDHTHDAKLIAQIESIGDEIENQVGPIRQRVCDEWYEGGHVSIKLRHAPSYGYGSSPYVTLMALSEYRGPIEYALAVVGTPTQGSVYSVMNHPEEGLVIRRTSGGATYQFWRDPNHPQQSVHAVYAVGQREVPRGVRTGALEAIRWHYENTMMVGRGFQTVADQQEAAVSMASPVLPRHALSHLAPYRRPPAFA